ncbi:MAG: hypothetical protein MUF64_00575 [Polyangiaceae bacterium]|jgi:hypothetical protein|nr:hypothetical protein [Polyangiaceae bacterium]
MWPLPPALPPPLPTATEQAPAPPEEFIRRDLELHLSGGLSTLRCDASAPTSIEQRDPCAALQAPHQGALGLFWRPWSRWALGAVLNGARFSWQPSPATGEHRGSARWTGVALAARWFPWNEGPWEPSIGYQTGLGWLTMEDPGSATTFRREGLVLAAQLGLARWLSSRTRLGVEAEVRWQATGAVETCKGSCLSVPLARFPDRSLGLLASISFAFGDEL